MYIIVIICDCCTSGHRNMTFFSSLSCCLSTGLLISCFSSCLDVVLIELFISKRGSYLIEGGSVLLIWNVIFGLAERVFSIYLLLCLGLPRMVCWILCRVCIVSNWEWVDRLTCWSMETLSSFYLLLRGCWSSGGSSYDWVDFERIRTWVVDRVLFSWAGMFWFVFRWVSSRTIVRCVCFWRGGGRRFLCTCCCGCSRWRLDWWHVVSSSSFSIFDKVNKTIIKLLASSL